MTRPRPRRGIPSAVRVVLALAVAYTLLGVASADRVWNGFDLFAWLVFVAVAFRLMSRYLAYQDRRHS